MEKEIFTLKGAYGDEKVFVSRLSPKDSVGKVIVLFHGVHGCASVHEGNKYAVLARMLLPLGLTVYLTETSRLRRDRDSFKEDRDRWARTAFQGKTYGMDLYDVCVALSEIEKRHPTEEIYLWGFSLGGIHSLMIAGGGYQTKLREGGFPQPVFSVSPSGIIISGSGDSIDKDDVSTTLRLPILDTIGDNALLYKSVRSIKTEWFVSFYGENDNTFSEEACRRLFDAADTPEKRFIIIPGADHAFRKLYGLPSIEPLKKMVSYLGPFFDNRD
ncbi:MULTISPECIES: alpha/beta hydrolase [Aminobacterium]|jgi:dienelactone hydrolase|uniref:alpha/beta hydrolase n=1 Tax=Aminobacterium TaxID=81466 RepID=UPI00257DF1E5|nr:alpha/beta hydrolase [Aminobacterium sp. UBA4987]